MLTPAQKQQLRDWIQANIHKAVEADWYREGIRDDEGRPILGECTLYYPGTNQPVMRPIFDDSDPPQQIGEEPFTYWGRTFILRSHQALDVDQLVYRTWRKLKKHFPDTDKTPEDVRDFLRPYARNIKTWAGTNIVKAGRWNRADIDRVDPDA